MALRAVPDHPKFAALKNKLGIPKYATLGILETLWHFGGRYTPQGNVGKYTDTEIEAWMEWTGEAGSLIQTLIDSRWIDVDSKHRILIHDWSQHADKATKQALKRSKLEFCVPSVHTPGAHNASLSSLPVPVPVPVPVPGPVPEPVPVPRSAVPKRKPDAPTYEAMKKAWDWYQAEYPKEVFPHSELRLFMSVMETPKDIEDLYANLPLYKSKSWQDGFAPSSENFLSKRMFNVKPKSEAVNGKHEPKYVYTPPPNLVTAESVAREQAERRRRNEEADAAEAKRNGQA